MSQENLGYKEQADKPKNNEGPAKVVLNLAKKSDTLNSQLGDPKLKDTPLQNRAKELLERSKKLSNPNDSEADAKESSRLLQILKTRAEKQAQVSSPKPKNTYKPTSSELAQIDKVINKPESGTNKPKNVPSPQSVDKKLAKEVEAFKDIVSNLPSNIVEDKTS